MEADLIQQNQEDYDSGWTKHANKSAEDAFVRRAREGMGNTEAQVSVEIPVMGKMYLWADKYRLRKPRCQWSSWCSRS
ncbi:Cactin [Takifugu flavidus]|uniref:Cactin n=1 Tax=Takifugu flavidus TaxID=433684 RepID=A0A5C6P179_9TELE|nr:Cactin [Takifugu flavidus]